MIRLIQVNDGTWLDPLTIVSIRAFDVVRGPRLPEWLKSKLPLCIRRWLDTPSLLIVTTDAEYSYVKAFDDFHQAAEERDRIADLVIAAAAEE